MKTAQQFVSYYFLMISLIWISSCSSYHTSYSMLNKKEAVGNEYQSKRPFRMMPTATHSSLLGGAGRVNFEVNLSQWVSSYFAVGISKKTFLFFQYDNQKLTVNGDPVNIQIRKVEGPGNDVANYDTSVFISTITPEDRMLQGSYTLGGGINLVKSNKLRITASVSFSSLNIENDYKYDYEYVDDRFSIFIESRKAWGSSLQGDIGYVFKNMEVAFTSRFSYLRFYSQDFSSTMPVEYYEMKPDLFYVEPALKFAIGGKTLRCYSQYNFIVPIVKGDVQWTPSKLEVGILFRFAD